MEQVTILETIAGVALLFTVFAIGMARAYVSAKK